MLSIILAVLLTCYAVLFTNQTAYQCFLIFGAYFLTAILVNLHFREYPEEKFELKDEDFKLIDEGKIFSIDELSTRKKKVYVKEEELFGRTFYSICTEIRDGGLQEANMSLDKQCTHFFETSKHPHYKIYLAKKYIFGYIWMSIIPYKYCEKRAELFFPQ